MGEKLRYEFSIGVARPADEVFDYVRDPANLAQWSAVVSRIDDPPEKEKVGRGTKVKGKIRFLCLSLNATAEIVDFDPQTRRIVTKTALPKKGTLESELSVEETGESSIVHYVARVTPPQFAQRFSEVLVSRAVESAGHHGLSNLRDVLESGEAATLRAAREELASEKAE
jgi:carbon monoxide dehydrogenase subunit G